jgi:cytochrome c oxidase cbb3-type subunit 1
VDSLIAMQPNYIARAVGGLLFQIGAVVGCYNIRMTIRMTPKPVSERLSEEADSVPSGTPAYQPGE